MERYPGNLLTEPESLFGCQWLRFHTMQMNPAGQNGRCCQGMAWQVFPEKEPETCRFFATYLKDTIPVSVWETESLKCQIQAYAPENADEKTSAILYTIEICNKSEEYQSGNAMFCTDLVNQHYQIHSAASDSIVLQRKDTNTPVYPYIGIFSVCPDHCETDQTRCCLKWNYSLAPKSSCTFEVTICRLIPQKNGNAASGRHLQITG